MDKYKWRNFPRDFLDERLEESQNGLAALGVANNRTRLLNESEFLDTRTDSDKTWASPWVRTGLIVPGSSGFLWIPIVLLEKISSGYIAPTTPSRDDDF